MYLSSTFLFLIPKSLWAKVPASYKEGGEITEVMTLSYSYNGRSVRAYSSILGHAKGTHTYIIQPFFYDLVLGVTHQRYKRYKKIAYQNHHHELDVTLEDGEKIPVTIDVLSFPSPDKVMAQCLEKLKNSGVVAVDVVSEAPTRCNVFMKNNSLYTIWFDYRRPYADFQKLIENWIMRHKTTKMH